MPCEDGIDAVLKDGQCRLERKGVPQEGAQKIVALGQKVRQDALSDGPGEHGEPMSKILGSCPLGPFHRTDVPIEGGHRLGHGWHATRVGGKAADDGPPVTLAGSTPCRPQTGESHSAPCAAIVTGKSDTRFHHSR